MKIFRSLSYFKFVVDDVDIEIIESRKWNIYGKGYVVSTSPIDGENLLHRIIMKAGLDQLVDHRNGKKWDNRRKNLRIVTTGVNTFASRIVSNLSGFRGVSKHASRDAYVAKIGVGGKVLFLGYRKTPEEAYELYKEACIKYYGELPP